MNARVQFGNFEAIAVIHSRITASLPYISSCILPVLVNNIVI